MSGFWKTVLASQMRRDAKTKSRQAQAARINAGKVGHRTGHNLREAEKLDRQADRARKTADRIGR